MGVGNFVFEKFARQTKSRDTPFNAQTVIPQYQALCSTLTPTQQIPVIFSSF